MSSSETSTKLASEKSTSQCDICQKFTRPDHLAIHRRIHFADTSQGKPFSCSYCPATFKQRHHLKCHLFLHTGNWPHVCDSCKAVFHCSTSFKKHKPVHSPNYLQNWLKCHKTVKDPTKCDVCGALFAHKCHLIQHQMNHEPEINYTCGLCGARYRHRKVLDDHIRFSHKGLKPFFCTDCDAKFAKKHELVAHKILHRRKSSKRMD